MSILDKIMSYLILLFNSKNSSNEPRDYIKDFERLHRNGLSDKDWEAKKVENPGYFVEPHSNHVIQTKK